MEICYIFPSEIFNLKLWNLKEETLKKNKKINSAERFQLKQRKKIVKRKIWRKFGN